MRRLSLAFSAALLATLASSSAFAQARGVGLGVGAGVAVPSASGTDALKPDFKAGFNWGFFVDIPLLYTFHITPSTLVYKMTDNNAANMGAYTTQATDVSLNFKFIIPVGPIAPFAGVTAGLTSTQHIDPHAGVLAGVGVSVLP